MKLTKDIAALKAAARAELDAIFAERHAAILGPLALIHARKADEARRVLADGIFSILLAPEAAKRGMSERALALAVLARVDRQTSQLVALEVERQDAQAAIDAATNPLELDAVLQRHR